jgi:hypothetical protein
MGQTSVTEWQTFINPNELLVDIEFFSLLFEMDWNLITMTLLITITFSSSKYIFTVQNDNFIV